MRNLKPLIHLAKRDFLQAHAGSIFGWVWLILRPALFVITLYLVFRFGLRPAGQTEVPFALYVAIGIVPWLYFADTLQSMLSLIQDNRFMLKIPNFSMHLLPLAKILSGAVAHLFLIFLLIFLAVAEGVEIETAVLQIFYYAVSLAALLLPISWIIAATAAFSKDISNLISILIQFGIWLTPIFWLIETLPREYQWLIKLNPLTYPVQGYRDSLLGYAQVWDRGPETVYFWIVVSAALVLSRVVFNRLADQFGEIS